jgi:hypothetical protein
MDCVKCKEEFFMKSFFRIFGIIAFVAVIGFSMVACDDGSDSGGGSGGGGGGTLTITNIPAKYNGRYAYFISEDKSLPLLGLQSFSTETITLIQIVNGQVSLPMWKATLSGNNITAVTRYSGNDTVTVGIKKRVTISSSPTMNEDVDESVINVINYGNTSIIFLNGSATKSCNDGTLNPTDNG